MLREEVAKNTEFGKYAATFLQTGALVPQERITEFLKEKLISPEIGRAGYVINGYPRDLEGLSLYLQIDRPTAVIHLVIDDVLARQRLEKRGRADDTPELINMKIRRYKEREKAVCEYIKTNTDIPFIEIDAGLPKEEVTKRIIDFIDE